MCCRGCARLPLDKAAQVHFAGPAGVDVASLVHTNALGRADLCRRLRNEGGNSAVLDAANADALLDAGVVVLIRLSVGDVDHVILANRDAARAAELLPFGDELAIAIEYLDATVGAIAHIDTPLRIERNRVQPIELALALAALAPRGDERAVL